MGYATLESRQTRAVEDGPEIVCLCGSTRFGDVFRAENLRLTLEGKIVLSIGCDTKSDDGLFAALPADEQEALKVRLDDLHKRKIDLAHRVLVVSSGGYFGDSTRSEIEYAMSIGAPVDFAEHEAKERWDVLAKG